MIKKKEISFLLFNIIVSFVLVFNNIFFIDIYYLSLDYISTYKKIILKFNFYTLVFITFLVFNYGFYFILYKFPKTFKIIIFIQLLLTFITGYFSSKYKVNIDDAFFINIIKEIGHAKEVIDFIDILIISGFILVVLYGIIKFSIKQEKISIKDFFNLTYLASKIKNYALFLSIIISIFLSFTVSFQSKYWYVFYEYKPLNREIKKEIFHGIFYYRYFYIIKDIVRYYKSSSSNEEILSTVQEGDVYLDKKFNNITTIFLMSDSVRAESMSLFGFKLNTNPNLQKLYGNKKIYLFKQNVCSTGTFRSLNCMLSLKTAENFRNIKASDYAKERITKYFNYLKIDTYYLANNQVDNITMAYKYIVDKNRYLDSDLFDEDAVFDREILLDLYESLNNNNQFITINLRGAHKPYDKILEDKFKKFDSKKYIKNDIDKNNYHNLVLQTDFLWSDIISNLSKLNKPVFVILTADHGESFGESYKGQIFTFHGASVDIAPPQQTQTPLIVYVNDVYKKLYPDYVKNIEYNMKKYQKDLIESDMISHSLLHCSGIEGNVVNKSLSLCYK